MEKTPISSREILRGYLNGSAEKLGYYLHLLSTCRKEDAGDRQSGQAIYLNENIAYETLSKNAFYAPIEKPLRSYLNLGYIGMREKLTKRLA